MNIDIIMSIGAAFCIAGIGLGFGAILVAIAIDIVKN